MPNEVLANYVAGHHYLGQPASRAGNRRSLEVRPVLTVPPQLVHSTSSGRSKAPYGAGFIVDAERRSLRMTGW